MKAKNDSIWSRGGRLALFAFQVTFVLIAAAFILKGVFSPSGKDTAGLEYKDFVSILLTALSAMVAIVAVFMAILAIWSYKHMAELVTHAAEKSASEKASEMMGGWLANDAPRSVSQQLELLTDTTLGQGEDSKAADDIGQQAG